MLLLAGFQYYYNQLLILPNLPNRQVGVGIVIINSAMELDLGDKLIIKKDFFIKSRKDDIREFYEFSPKVTLLRFSR